MRAEFANELESATMLKRDEGGTATGAFNRFWAEFKGKLGGGDHTLLETAERGEDTANETYKKALNEDVNYCRRTPDSSETAKSLADELLLIEGDDGFLRKGGLKT
jgi:uncharacterized protein (TIGR02284 family)